MKYTETFLTVNIEHTKRVHFLTYAHIFCVKTAQKINKMCKERTQTVPIIFMSTYIISVQRNSLRINFTSLLTYYLLEPAYQGNSCR